MKRFTLKSANPKTESSIPELTMKAPHPMEAKCFHNTITFDKWAIGAMLGGISEYHKMKGRAMFTKSSLILATYAAEKVNSR